MSSPSLVHRWTAFQSSFRFTSQRRLSSLADACITCVHGRASLRILVCALGCTLVMSMRLRAVVVAAMVVGACAGAVVGIDAGAGAAAGIDVIVVVWAPGGGQPSSQCAPLGVLCLGGHPSPRGALATSSGVYVIASYVNLCQCRDLTAQRHHLSFLGRSSPNRQPTSACLAFLVLCV